MIGVGKHIIDKETRIEYVVTYVAQNEDNDWVCWAKPQSIVHGSEQVCVLEREVENKYYVQLPLHKDALAKAQRKANDKLHRKSAVTYYSDGW